MGKRTFLPVWIGVILLAGMFLMGQEAWERSGPTITVIVPAEGWFGG